MTTEVEVRLSNLRTNLVEDLDTGAWFVDEDGDIGVVLLVLETKYAFYPGMRVVCRPGKTAYVRILDKVLVEEL